MTDIDGDAPAADGGPGGEPPGDDAKGCIVIDLLPFEVLAIESGEAFAAPGEPAQGDVRGEPARGDVRGEAEAQELPEATPDAA